MSYADTLLANDEQVVLRRRQHWMALLRAVIRGWLLWLIAAVVLWAVVWFVQRRLQQHRQSDRPGAVRGRPWPGHLEVAALVDR